MVNSDSDNEELEEEESADADLEMDDVDRQTSDDHQEKPFAQKLHLGRLVINFAYLNHLRWNFGHLRCNLSLL